MVFIRYHEYKGYFKCSECLLHLFRGILHITTLQFTRYKTILELPNHTQNTCMLTAVTAAKSVLMENPLSHIIEKFPVEFFCLDFSH